MSFKVQDWYNEINSKDVLLQYKGEVTGNIISDLLVKTETLLGDYLNNYKLRKRCYNVTVEALQNLYHHIDKTPGEIADKYGPSFAAFFLVRVSEEVFKIVSGNFVKSQKIKLLQDRTDQINHLTKNELKILYKLILNNEEFSEKGGGGLGMIDIARKTGNKLNVNFYKYNKDYFFFSLEIVIS